jgi:methylmalonyl-CoA mutase cobalamin-binding domain/chain
VFGEAGRANPSLLRVIETEIIPRLLLAHGLSAEGGRPAHPRPAVAAASPAASSLERIIDAIARAALDGDVEAGVEMLDQARHMGFSGLDVCEHVLSATARRFGVWWEEENCDFLEVTAAVGRLQTMLRLFAARRAPPPLGVGPLRSVLLAAMPGEQHSLGLGIVEQAFRDAGFLVDMHGAGSRAEAIVAALSQDYVDVLGLSVSCERHLADLAPLIRRCRKVSLNRDLVVIVGGAAVHRADAAAEVCGADAMVGDAREALRAATELLSGRRADQGVDAVGGTRTHGETDRTAPDKARPANPVS